MKPTNIGDRVRYSAAFLRSAGLYTGKEAFRIGTVTSLVNHGGTFVIAKVKWDDEPEYETHVLASDLAVKGKPEPA